MKTITKSKKAVRIPLAGLEVIKANGERAPFVPEKVLRSLTNAGANEAQASEILNAIMLELRPGMSTRKIYELAFRLLKQNSRHLAARYNLKDAIMQLGPSGFPFEKYIGEILKCQGYSIQVGKILKGHCVNHEIDVVAEKDNHHFMIECKFHNSPGTICDVKIPLYIYARFKDVEEQWLELPGHSEKFHQGWVVTNTRFTKDAIQYGRCRDLKLLSWDYPSNESLKGIIDEMGLYPITCLTTLTKIEKLQLLKNNVVMCKEICHNPGHLNTIGMSPSRIKAVVNEGHQLCYQLIKHGQH